jgi:hypothetical protein
MLWFWLACRIPGTGQGEERDKEGVLRGRSRLHIGIQVILTEES